MISIKTTITKEDIRIKALWRTKLNKVPKSILRTVNYTILGSR
jgi:hypothetical protein